VARPADPAATVAYHPPVDDARDGTGPRSVISIIPIGSLEGAKSRLGAVLDAEERLTLVRRLAELTIRGSVGADLVDDTLVITPDDEVRALALTAGARPIRQRTRGLNAGLREARDEAVAGGAGAVLIVPIDLPSISSVAIDDILRRMVDLVGPVVGIVPDRHGRGTNALYLCPPEVIDVQFGGDSRAAHDAAAREAGARVVQLGGPLTVDIDTPEDLLHAEAVDPELVHG
jgi:2-phospho-L-lactate guanylyltransferase